MHYHQYYPIDVVNGLGTRCSLFVSGCEHQCKGCYNQSTWRLDSGHLFTQEMSDRIIADLKDSKVRRRGLSLSGGDPLHPANLVEIYALVTRVRNECPDKDIWCWTGYTWEELMRPGETPDKLELLQLIDILVDGRYLKDQHDSLLQFRGSRNQRILDVPRSLAAGRPVVWAKLHDQERDIPEMYLKDREAGEGAQAS